MPLLRKRKYLVLIVTLVGVLLVHSFIQEFRPFVSDVLVTLILLMVLMVVFEGRLERTVALVGTLAAIAVTWSHHVIPSWRIGTAASRCSTTSAW